MKKLGPKGSGNKKKNIGEFDYIGVGWNATKQRWITRVYKSGKTKVLGSFRDELEGGYSGERQAGLTWAAWTWTKEAAPGKRTEALWRSFSLEKQEKILDAFQAAARTKSIQKGKQEVCKSA